MAEHIVSSAEASLRALGTDYLDILRSRARIQAIVRRAKGFSQPTRFGEKPPVTIRPTPGRSPSSASTS